MKKARLKELMDGFRQVKIAVLGDLFLDRWLTIDPALDELSLETGKTAWQVVGEKCCAGAAGTVLNNLAALGVGKLYAISLLGMDGAGWEILHALEQKGIDTHLVIQSGEIRSPQYVKPLFKQTQGPAVEGNRLDVKNWQATAPELEDRLIQNLESIAAQMDAVMVLDQLDTENTGVVTQRMRERLERLAKEYPNLILYADSRAFIHRFRDVVIKCNDREAALMTTGKEPEGDFAADAVFASMEKLKALTGKPVYVTCNVHGVAAEGKAGWTLVPAVRQTGPIDVCGAGDACSAGIVSALCAGATPVEAAFVGNMTAGVTVRKHGDTGTASQGEVRALYEEQFGEDRL